MAECAFACAVRERYKLIRWYISANPAAAGGGSPPASGGRAVGGLAESRITVTEADLAKGVLSNESDRAMLTFLGLQIKVL